LISGTSDVIQQYIETGTARRCSVEDSDQSEFAVTKKAEIALSRIVFQK
jgi:hypothetical protein